MPQNFTGKTVLITGASRGFGATLAIELAEQGAHVIALARTTGGLEELDNKIRAKTGASATLIPFDLTAAEAQFQTLGETLFNRFQKLDHLILNAAILVPLSPVAHTQEKNWRLVMEVNFFANTRLLRCLDPLLRHADNPHITFVTCGESSMGNGHQGAHWGAYAASKKALDQLALSYGEENRAAGFHVHRFDPGPMPTALRRTAFPGEDQTTMARTEAVAEKLVLRLLQ